jgi:hypothetical protein
VSTDGWAISSKFDKYLLLGSTVLKVGVRALSHLHQSAISVMAGDDIVKCGQRKPVPFHQALGLVLRTISTAAGAAAGATAVGCQPGLWYGPSITSHVEPTQCSRR